MAEAKEQITFPINPAKNDLAVDIGIFLSPLTNAKCLHTGTYMSNNLVHVFFWIEVTYV